MLVLSLFPGIDLLGRAFELAGFCVVRGPDLLWGGDIKTFHAPADRFDGCITGTPCQEFSRKRRKPATGYGIEMLEEFARVVTEARPNWFLLENVPSVPDVHITGYTVQRFDLNARECGLSQSRLRHFQFGSSTGLVIVPRRQKFTRAESQLICLASEGKRTNRRAFADFCELQGLPRTFHLPGLSLSAKYSAVGNGVALPVGIEIARAIKEIKLRARDVRLCACNCGRILEGRQKAARPACRKRLQRQRHTVTARLEQSSGLSQKAVTISGVGAVAESQ
jgi:DNA (cytosine-5)-methyltransferase 1